MIRVEHLAKKYGLFEAIKEVDFAVRKGEVVGFLGPNGAGKTTTMRIIAGCIGASSGQVLLDGRNIQHHPIVSKKKIGYLPEVPPLYPSMIVEEYLLFAAKIKKVSKPKEALENVLKAVGLVNVRNRFIEQLSKGYKQRVGLAQALIHNPDLLILDEPTSGLDPAQRIEIRELLQSLAQGERTIILSTHVLSEVEAICERVIIISQGEIVAQDSIAKLQSKDHGIRILVGRPCLELKDKLLMLEGVTKVETIDSSYRIESSIDTRAQIAATAVAFDLLHMSRSDTLEDIYLRLTGES
jgi:ABC-2 type transport system ATP-binding protein